MTFLEESNYLVFALIGCAPSSAAISLVDFIMYGQNLSTKASIGLFIFTLLMFKAYNFRRFKIFNIQFPSFLDVTEGGGGRDNKITSADVKVMISR